MVGAGRERIAAVVGRYHQNVVGFHIIYKRREPRVEFGDGFCISVHVVSVAVFHIEVHKVHKAKPVEVLCLQFFRNAHAVGVIADMISFLYALSVENIVNLSDADGVQSFSFDKVKHGVAGGSQGKVVAVIGADKVRITAYERSCDYPSDAVFTRQNFACDFAITIQFFHGDDVLVRGNLEHAVGGRINDERARVDVFFAKVFYDFRAGIRLIAQSFSAGLFFKLVDDFFRKAVGERGQRIFRHEPSDFPVPDGSVLARRFFGKPRINARRIFDAAFNAVDVEHSKFFQVVSHKKL